jgi:hypothetical protein
MKVLKLNLQHQWRVQSENSAFTVTDETAGVNVVTAEAGANADSIYIDTDGEVGFGTNAPSQKVDVNGSIRLRANIYDSSNTLGTSGQVLKSQAGGGVVWANDADSGGSPIAGGSEGMMQFNSAGTISGSDLFFWDGVNDRVGIGKADPQHSLETTGSIMAGRDIYIGANIYDSTDSLGTSGQVLLSQAGGGIVWGDDAADAVPTGEQGMFQYNEAGSFSGASGIYFDGSMNIGVGAGAPSESIHVNKTTNNVYVKSQSSFANSSAGFKMQNDAREYSVEVFGDDTFVINDETAGTIPFRIGAAAPTDALFIEGTTGDIGIGTTAPTTELTIGDPNGITGDFAGDGEVGFADLHTVVSTTDASGSVAYNLMVNEGSRRTRAKFFLTDRLSPHGRWGHWLSWSSAGNQPYVIGAGTTQLLMIDETGKVGLGDQITTPQYTLDVNDSANPMYLNMQTSATDGRAGMRLANDARSWFVRIDTDDSFELADETAGTRPFTVEPATPSNSVYVNSTGQTGFGNTPTQQVDVAGSIRIRANIYDSANSLGTSGQVLKSNAGGGVKWEADNDSGGSPIAGGSEGMMQFNSAGTISGSDLFFWDGVNDRVGIGKADPQHSLETTGSIMAGRDLYIGANIYDSTDSFGTSGQVLTSNAGGGIVWAAAGAADGVGVSGAAGADNRMPYYITGEVVSGSGFRFLNSTQQGTLHEDNPQATFHVSGSAKFAMHSGSLEVAGRERASFILSTHQTNSRPELRIKNESAEYAFVVDGPDLGTDRLKLWNVTDNTYPFKVYDNTGDNLLILDGSQVGIGTEPSEKLHVKSSVELHVAAESTSAEQANFHSINTIRAWKFGVNKDGDCQIKDETAGGKISFLMRYGTPEWTFYASGSVPAGVQNGGNINIGHSGTATGRLHVFSSGSVGAVDQGIVVESATPNSTAFIEFDDNENRWRAQSEDSKFTITDETAGVNVATFDAGAPVNSIYVESGGEVGLGDATPSQKLHVSGSIRVVGGYYDSSNSSGPSGYVLTSNGTGDSVVWEKPNTVVKSMFIESPGIGDKVVMFSMSDKFQPVKVRAIVSGSSVNGSGPGIAFDMRQDVNAGQSGSELLSAQPNIGDSSTAGVTWNTTTDFATGSVNPEYWISTVIHGSSGSTEWAQIEVHMERIGDD